jgi:hypothetical protein
MAFLVVYGWKNGKPGHVGVVLNDITGEVEQRALSMVGEGKYKLGTGGYKEGMPDTPFNRLGQSDCSGFALWCFKIDRRNRGKGPAWWNTSSIIKDALTDKILFHPLDKPARFADCTVVHCRSGRPAVVSTTGALWDRKLSYAVTPVLL